MSCLLFVGEVVALEHESILPRLDAAAEALKNATALEDTNGSSLAWSELIMKSATLSQSLCSRGVVSGSRIGIFQEPTVDWIVTMLGVWRAGASYVPLDPAQGLERLAKIAKNAELTAIVVQEATLSSVEKLGLAPTVVVVNMSAPDLRDNFSGSIIDQGTLSNVKGSDEAMVLYTSGTTGEPKVSQD
jgi:hybrid polyketide synthase / nonribosomal peptide synthetase ACE1